MIYITGGIRACLDSYSDWGNPLLAKKGYVVVSENRRSFIND